MENMLDKIIAGKKKEVERLKKELSQNPSHPIHVILKQRGETGRQPGRLFERALKQGDLSIIAEVKRRSPSSGEIGEIANPAALVELYAEGGAAAISVLTDQESFGGSLEDLKEVKKSCNLPILRKDFTIDAVQIAEALHAGASAILIIVAATGDRTEELLLEAKRMGIEALVEVNNKEELEIAIRSGARIIGVNNRDLKTFQLDPKKALELKELIPQNITTVAASGIKTIEDTKQIREAGYDAILIGQMLVESENPKELIEQIRGAK